MKPLRTIVAGAALAVSLVAASAAHAGTVSGAILLPCATPGITYSDLMNQPLVPNGVCGWLVNVAGPTSYTLSTASADLDLWFYDGAGDSLGVETGGSACGAFTGTMPAGTKRVVVYLTASMCDNFANVAFTFTY